MELDFIQWGANLLVLILGWFARMLWTAQEKMREDFNKMERDMPLAYVRRDEFKDVVKEMKESFKEAIHPVLSKLDRMEEKMEEQAKENDRLFLRKD